MTSTTSSTTTLTPAPWLLRPVTPLESSRHEPNECLGSEPQILLPSGVRKKELDRCMYPLGDLPAEWKQYIHVDGKLYFQHLTWRVVTESYIRDPNVRSQLEDWYHQVEAARSKKGSLLDLSERHELYLTLHPQPAYYFVDHDSLSILWLDDIHLKQLSQSKFSGRSFEIFIEQNYYCHLENFPIHNKLPDGAEEFLQSTLIYACIDHMTSRESSTVPWNAQDAKTFLELLQELPDATSKSATQVTAGYKTWIVSRLLCDILLNRWVHRHGMRGARTDRLASFSGPRIEQKLTKLGDVISGVLFFCAHYTYIDRLENAWANKIISIDEWQKLLTSLLLEWSDSNLLATVTLSANMAFLALNGLQDVEKIASIASALFAIGSIIVGLHHVWRHRVKIDTDAQQAGIYFRNATRMTGNMKLLAFFLSLPLIMLSWSLVIFTFSVATYAFRNTQLLRSYIVMAIALFAVVTVIVVTIMFFWGIFRVRDGFRSSRSTWNNLLSGFRPLRKHRNSQP